MAILKTHDKIDGTLLRIKSSNLRNSQEEDKSHLRMHKNVETVHYPYPASLLSFNETETLDPRSSALRKWTQNNRYGDEEPDVVTDNIKYRVSEATDVYRSYFGYAPKEPIQEIDSPLEDVTISHGEVQFRASRKGIEFISLYEVPFVAYEIFVDDEVMLQLLPTSLGFSAGGGTMSLSVITSDSWFTTISYADGTV